MSRPTWDDAATLARRTLYDVAYAAAVGASHLERARNRVLLIADDLIPRKPPAHPTCTLCGAAMVRTPGKTRGIDWWRCSAKPHELVGVPVREAA